MCPENETLSQLLVKPKPEWDVKRLGIAPTVLAVESPFPKPTLGGACSKLKIRNQAAAQCDQYQVLLNVRPSWGYHYIRNGDWLEH